MIRMQKKKKKLNEVYSRENLLSLKKERKTLIYTHTRTHKF